MGSAVGIALLLEVSNEQKKQRVDVTYLARDLPNSSTVWEKLVRMKRCVRGRWERSIYMPYLLVVGGVNRKSGARWASDLWELRISSLLRTRWN